MVKSNSDWLYSKTGKLQSFGSSWVNPYEKSSITNKIGSLCIFCVIFMRGDPQPMALEWIKKTECLREKGGQTQKPETCFATRQSGVLKILLALKYIAFCS